MGSKSSSVNRSICSGKRRRRVSSCFTTLNSMTVKLHDDPIISIVVWLFATILFVMLIQNYLFKSLCNLIILVFVGMRLIRCLLSPLFGGRMKNH